MQLKSGNPYPLGATWDGRGVNFSMLLLFNSHSEPIDFSMSFEKGRATVGAPARRSAGRRNGAAARRREIHARGFGTQALPPQATHMTLTKGVVAPTEVES